MNRATSAQDDDDLGAVLLQSRYRPLYAVSILATGLLVLLLALDGLYLNLAVPSDGGSLARGAFGVVLLCGLLAAGFGVWQLLRPAVFVEATERGLVLRRLPGAPRAAGAPGSFLVPWSRIRALDLEVHALPTGIRRARMTTIAVRLAADGDPQVPAGFSHLLKPLPGSDPGAIYLDAQSGIPGGRELLRRLEELWARRR